MDLFERRALPDDVRHYISTLRAMVEECPLAMVGLDRDDIVRIWSRRAEQMFGWTEEEALGRPLPAARELLDAQLHLDSSQGAELAWPRKDGEPLHVTFSVAPLRDEEGNIQGKVVFIADITSRGESEQERLELVKSERSTRASESRAAVSGIARGCAGRDS